MPQLLYSHILGHIHPLGTQTGEMLLNGKHEQSYRPCSGAVVGYLLCFKPFTHVWWPLLTNTTLVGFTFLDQTGWHQDQEPAPAEPLSAPVNRAWMKALFLTCSQEPSVRNLRMSLPDQLPRLEVSNRFYSFYFYGWNPV